MSKLRNMEVVEVVNGMGKADVFLNKDKKSTLMNDIWYNGVKWLPHIVKKMSNDSCSYILCIWYN